MNTLSVPLPYRSSALSLDGHFYECAAQILLKFAASITADYLSLNDLSSLQVIAPRLSMANELRKALINQPLRAPMLLPVFSTLNDFAQNTQNDRSAIEPISKSERQLLLYEALRQQRWFDENALWAITAEMGTLFDELSIQSVALPDTLTALTAQLEAAYAVRASSHLAFEARVIHETWHTLTSFSQPDPIGAYHLNLAKLAQQATKPLFMLLDNSPEATLSPTEQQFLNRYAENAPLMVVYPETRHETSSVLMQTLSCAWPQTSDVSLYERARSFPYQSRSSPLTGRLQLAACDGSEKEAQTIVAQIRQWLLNGLSNIALIASDRLIARRVRALLEREHILVIDETGWKLSTSRAAATIDALLEVVVGQGYYRDLLDLCKSPFVFADMQNAERRESLQALEHVIRGASVKMGIAKIQRALTADKELDPTVRERTVAMLERIDKASAFLQGRPAPLAHWLEHLGNALTILGAQDFMQNDAAGKKLLDLFATRRQELQKNTALFSRDSWREWLDNELEAAYFRDENIQSPIVLTSLQAATLRHFDAALIMGADAEHMSATAGNTFFNQATRRELGLPLVQQAQEEKRHQLSTLIALIPHITITWQSERQGESNLPAPEFSLLSTVHQLIWQDNLYLKKPLPIPESKISDQTTQPLLIRQSQPSVPSADLPQKISVSAYATLVACPYRFFARHVLGLGEMDEVSESMAKNDYGALVHRTLERFHHAHPQISHLSMDDALTALKACVHEVFSQAVTENFRSMEWQLRLEKRLPAYLIWQYEQEKQGWRYGASETALSICFDLEHHKTLSLYGRIDRLDNRKLASEEDESRLLDYKTQTGQAIRNRLEDDTQLPAYALLHGNAVQTAYVALDDDVVDTFSSSQTAEELHQLAQQQKERLIQVFNLLHAGHPLPAHGAEKVCDWCEMQGLCRRAYVSS